MDFRSCHDARHGLLQLVRENRNRGSGVPLASQALRALGSGPQQDREEHDSREDSMPAQLALRGQEQKAGLSNGTQSERRDQFQRGYEREMLSSLQQLDLSGVRVIEDGDFEGVSIGDECVKLFGKGSALRLSSSNGGDLESSKGRSFVTQTISGTKPQYVWFRPQTSAFSPIQKMNQRTPEQVMRLQAKQEQAKQQYEGLAEVFRATAALGITCVLEMPEMSGAWRQQWYLDLARDLRLYEGLCQGCQMNLRNYQGALSCKGWGLSSTDGALVQNMSLACDGKHSRRAVVSSGLHEGVCSPGVALCRAQGRLGPHSAGHLVSY